MDRTPQRRRGWARATAIVFAVVTGCSPAAAAGADGPYGVGERLERVVLEDQHGVERAVDASSDVILFTRDMDAGDIVKAALADTTAEQLDARHVVYVSDISAMPAMVARLLALPKMRKRPYPMLLDRDGDATARFPARAGLVTVLRVDDLEIVAVEYIGDSAAVTAIVAGSAQSVKSASE
ncbi:MAG: hypothetical protein E4H03_05350 [Myxococcales bacterium]|jgi:hypothetical protein|nr:MAG: hypothetical protein E4H03_05350 [Myxococcales bacterium]